MKKQLVKYAIAAPIILSGLYLVFRYNPENSWWMPKCPFHLLTGLQCPSCGNTRALHCLLHGRFADALAFNAMAPVLTGIFIAIVLLLTVGGKSTSDRPVRLLVMAYVLVYLVWLVVRNILGI